MHPSPPGSSGGSPQIMVAPVNPFAIPPSVARPSSLAAPNIPRTIPRSPGYSSHSYSHSTSPSTGSGGLSDIPNHDTPGLMVSPTQISSASLNAQKRAYRQRRKDPSCDACRERKVKCDATETSACSECSSRNHKCQFTKETNRRMSSIKQVQDLQSQIAELTQLNSHLRTQVVDREEVESERPDSKRRHSEIYSGTPHPPHRIAAPPLPNFEHVRENILVHSEGIFRTPHMSRLIPAGDSSKLPELPLRADFARLARNYTDSIHEWYPILHWPTFRDEADQAYAERSFHSMSREWTGLFFAVLACGSLQVPQPHNNLENSSLRGAEFYDIAAQALTPWPSIVTITHAQTAFLLSVFAQESNLGSVGEIWLSSAIGAAQELGLYLDINSGSVIDVEVRRRLWWALYVRDRVTSLEMSRPMSIHEEDCETTLPVPVEDRYIQPHGVFRSHGSSVVLTGFSAVIQITHLHAQIYKSLKSSILFSQTMSKVDDQMQMKMMQLPESYRIGSNAPLEVAALPPLITLLSAHYHLYRRNLSPICRHAERAEALARCVTIAQDTAKYISRAFHNPPKQEMDKSWQDRVGCIVSNLVCKHLWRCILVLCYHNDYDAALVCQHLSATIGKSRKANIACAKHLQFFLGLLLERAQSGHGSPRQPEHDEDMLAYVSGDMQASIGQSWVWTGLDLTSTASTGRAEVASGPCGGSDETMRDAHSVRPGTISPEGVLRDEEQWNQVERMIRQLKDDGRPRTSSYYPPPHNPLKRVQLAADTNATTRPLPISSPAPSSASRISIANII